uniref:hypothetical protein n=1 Tax=Thaumasiovibrio occultus TaxID=1891184 RepID=UPI000B35F6A9|nr:hypothetical protein [Thaumasiovibrio occultus]
MTVDPVNRSPLGYTAPSKAAKAPDSPQVAAEPAQKLPESAQLQRIVAELDEAEQQKVASQSQTEGAEQPTSNAKAFAYGALGMDHPEAVKQTDDDAYTAGQVMSALGTIGGIIALLV